MQRMRLQNHVQEKNQEMYPFLNEQCLRWLKNVYFLFLKSVLHDLHVIVLIQYRNIIAILISLFLFCFFIVNLLFYP